MAIDTVNERRSVQAYTLGLMRPLVDGTIGPEDRSVIAWLYYREAAALVPPPAPIRRIDVEGTRRNVGFAWSP